MVCAYSIKLINDSRLREDLLNFHIFICRAPKTIIQAISTGRASDITIVSRRKGS